MSDQPMTDEPIIDEPIVGEGARWADTDRWLEAALLSGDPALEAALADARAAGLPAIDVSPTQGKLLHLLARAIGARRILEVGTLGGYSTIWLARALPEGGRLVSLELSERHAGVARSNLERAGLDGVAEVRVGPAAATLAGLVAASEAPFDMVFVDADKRSNPEYLRRALELTRPGSMIVVDNVVRHGAVADPSQDDDDLRGTRDALSLLGSEPRLVATALQTVGSKGWDGLAVALVVA